MNNNRKLSVIEQAMELMNRHNGSYNVVTISRIKGKISEETLRQALDKIQSIHPLLNSRIIGTLDNLEFITEGTAKIPLSVVSQGENEIWQDLVKEELNKTIESSNVLLRCLLIYRQSEINTSYLITTVHHAISDGLSCVNLQSQILSCYQIIDSGNSLDVDCVSALPSLEELLPKWMKGNKGISKGKWFLLKSKLRMLWHKPEGLDIEETVPIEYRSCGMNHKILEIKLTQKLIELCRQEKTTVQGALCAAMLLIVANKIRGEKTKNINILCNSYVDLRRRLEPPISNENMGILASAITSLHKIKPQTSFWDLARDVTKDIGLGLKRKDIFKPLMLLRKIFENYINNPDKFQAAVHVTNIGKVNIPDVYGNLKLEEISFVASNAIFGRSFTVAATTFDGKMILNFVASKPSISQHTIEMFADSVINCLVEVCQ